MISYAQLAQKSHRPDTVAAADPHRATDILPPFLAHDGHTGFSPEVVRLIEDIRDAADLEGARAAAVRLISLIRPQAALTSVGACSGLVPWRRRKLELYLGERLTGPIRLEELAAQVSLSVGYFCRAFKETFGLTPHEYLMRLRLQQAERLMLATTEPLAQIAHKCGFGDQAHLSKVFRRVRGETPAAWRRCNRSDPRIEASRRRSTTS